MKPNHHSFIAIGKRIQGAVLKALKGGSECRPAVQLPVWAYVLLAANMVLLSGCNEPAAQASSDSSNYMMIVTEFREFYDLLGGENLIGPAISPEFEEGGYIYQYTTTALMVHNPNGNDNQRFLLAPLGIELNKDYGLYPENMETARAEASPEIYAPFLHLYEKMGGGRFVGLPLGPVQHEAENKRYVQHFENLGFYQLEGEDGRVGLLPYGTWMQGSGPPGVSAGREPEKAQEINGAFQNGISLEIWKSSQLVKQGQIHEVGVTMMSGSQPAAAYEPGLIIYLPDGTSQQINFPPTNEYGETSLTLPDIAADNGTLIPIEVCVEAAASSHFCVRESLLVWDLP